MRYMVEANYVLVTGDLWMPGKGATRINLTSSDVASIGEFTRANVEQWLASHSGDFQSIDGFYATVGDQEIPWTSEDAEFQYGDCMNPRED